MANSVEIPHSFGMSKARYGAESLKQKRVPLGGTRLLIFSDFAAYGAPMSPQMAGRAVAE